MKFSPTSLRRSRLTFLGSLTAVFVCISLLVIHQPEKDSQKLSEHFRDSWTGSNTTDGIQSAAPSLNESSVSISRPFFQYLVSRLRNSAFPGARNYSEYALIQQPEQFPILPGVRPMRTDFGPVVNDVASFRYPIEIPPCRDAIGVTGLFLVIISAPSYFDKRDVIRKTWLSQLLKSNATDTPALKLVGHGFVIGLTGNGDTQKRIDEESAVHGDILQVNMIDTYENLTHKVVGALNWINSHCSRMDFVLKVDDDVYVNTRNLISVIRNLNSSQESIHGTSADGVVRRDDKFRVSVDRWPWSTYPPYCMGAFLLMTGRTIEPLLAAAQTTPYFPFEDTYIGLCADKAGVKMRFSERALVKSLTNNSQPCHVHSSISWLTQTVNDVKMFHTATEEFYKNVTQCKQMQEMPIDPNITRAFVFT